MAAFVAEMFWLLAIEATIAAVPWDLAFLAFTELVDSNKTLARSKPVKTCLSIVYFKKFTLKLQITISYHKLIGSKLPENLSTNSGKVHSFEW